MTADMTTYERLAAPFALDQHAKVPKGGMQQTYVPWTDYVDRLNNVLGPDQWSFRIIREGFTESECWVLAEITATIDGQQVVRQQYGCEPIARGQRPTSDLLKSTASDALKKAASLLGPGLYLSMQEERAKIEAAMQEAIRAAVGEQRAPGKAPAGSGTPPTKSATNVCADCRADIRSARAKDGTIMTPADIATLGRHRFGKVLCATCYAAAIKADMRAKEAVGAA